MALARAIGRPGVSALLLGASATAQLAETVAALGVTLTAEQTSVVDAASATDPVFPYSGDRAAIRRGIFGGHGLAGWV